MTSPAGAAGTAPIDGRVRGGAPLRAALPRALVVLLGAAAVVVVAAGIRSVAWLIGPAFLALIIVIALAPVQGWLRRIAAVVRDTVLVVAVEGVMLLLALTVVISIARLATALPQYAGESQELAQSATTALARFGVGPAELRQVVESLDLGKLSGLLAAILGSVAGIATNLVFILTLLLFLGVETGAAGSRIADIASDRPEIGRHWRSSPTAPGST